MEDMKIVLANWPSFKRIVCSTHNNILIEIHSHPYDLFNRMILCNCIIEAKNNFLLESIAMCDPDNVGADLEMYFVANIAFLNYFERLIHTLEVPSLHNVTMQSNSYQYLWSQMTLTNETLMSNMKHWNQKMI